MSDSIDRFIMDEEGNVVDVGVYSLGAADPIPLANGAEVNLRWAKDNLSGKFYPITSKSYIIGGIGRGSSREVIDFGNYINANFSGSFKLISIGDHIKYFVLNVDRKTGVLQGGDNILVNALPVNYYPQKDLIFRSSISPDTTSRITVYLGAADGIVHCFVDPINSITLDPGLISTPVLSANNVTGLAVYLE